MNKMTKKTTDIVSYISLIGWLIAMIAGDRAECKFHLNQGLVLGIAEILFIVISVLLEAILPLQIFFTSIAGCFLLIVWALALASAVQEKETPMPALGKIHLIS